MVTRPAHTSDAPWVIDRSMVPFDCCSFLPSSQLRPPRAPPPRSVMGFCMVLRVSDEKIATFLFSVFLSSLVFVCVGVFPSSILMEMTDQWTATICLLDSLADGKVTSVCSRLASCNGEKLKKKKARLASLASKIVSALNLPLRR